MAHIPCVEDFNEELQSLLSIKPPISVTKITSITRAAIKAIKYHKHVVHSVERFISKCPYEYKLPGLYVIDSIVKNSIGQFKQRDVFADRFARNLQHTFSRLFYNCMPEERSKMLRVLSVWEKNQFFNPSIIKPIIEMSETNSFRSIQAIDAPLSPPDDIGGGGGGGGNVPSASTELLLQHLSDTIARVKDRHNAGGTSSKDSHKYNNSISRNNNYNDNLINNNNNIDDDDDVDDDDGDETPTEAEPPLSTTLSKIEQEHRRKINNSSSSTTNNTTQEHSHQQHHHHQSSSSGGGSSGSIKKPAIANERVVEYRSSGRQPVLERWNRLIGQTTSNSNSHTDKYEARYSRSRSRTRSRSRSISPIQANHNHHHHYDQRYASHESPRSRSITPEQVFDAETLNERKKKGLPEPRKGYLTICSSTLWLGHVPKNISEAEISDAFGEYGTINRIDLIPPRGCAYVCMDRRQDAMKALKDSKKIKLNSNHIKMAWAPGKGLKDKKFKDFWEVDIGASFIPVSKIDKSVDIDTLEEGGVIDEATMTPALKELRDEHANDLSTPNSAINPPSPPQPQSISLPLISQATPNFPINNFPQNPLPQLPMHFGSIPNLRPDLLDNPANIDNMARLAPTMIPIPDPNIFRTNPQFNIPPPMLSMPGGPNMAQMYQNPPVNMFNALPPTVPLLPQPPPLAANDQPTQNLWPPLLPKRNHSPPSRLNDRS